MRTVADRIRHALLFELLGFITVTSLSGWVFKTNFIEFGPLALMLSLIATTWNYVFNVMFDHGLVRWKKRIYKTLMDRVVHSLLFEIGMLVLTLPLVMWWLGYGLVEAFNMSIALMIFYLIYTYVYNLAYDKVFPIPEFEQ